MMLNRSNDVELDFDFDKVREKQKIIQFFMFNTHMLGSTLFKNIKIKIIRKISLNENHINFNEMEEKIIRKVLNGENYESTSRKFDLHKIPFYLYELPTLFHAY